MLSYVLLALLSAVAMASSGIIARFSGLAAAELTFYRLAVGALCLLLFVTLTGKLAALKGKPDWRMAVNGVLLAGFMLSFLTAIAYISLANAIMLVYLAPPLSAFLAHWLLQEKLDLADSSLILLSFLGFAMLQQFKFDLVLDAAQLPGLLYGLLALLCYSGFLLLNRHSLPAHSQLQRTFYQLIIGACCVLPFLTEMQMPQTEDMIWIVLAGIFPGFIAIYCAIVALQHLPTRLYATLAYLEPVTVILAGWWLFGESLSALQQSGVVLIIFTGLALAVRHKPAKAVVAVADAVRL
ncbi:MAG: DMT family transporter [Gammaproteobacteria bacterium]|nr:DMT family transporter [Gammaproteobacteria bacterium]MBU1555448.1 DMT family transporter [Gammaproteobacteria bacterium]MBU2070903.1 DMT family transporter [Gammaproteobacteria bacterium]MBU2183419.1 DMT family transporter [Gammaproteobacteria bacterium]MBU2204109.1 DMT family transporter [Gammaproteobacteria bacterium]